MLSFKEGDTSLVATGHLEADEVVVQVLVVVAHVVPERQGVVGMNGGAIGMTLEFSRDSSSRRQFQWGARLRSVTQ